MINHIEKIFVTIVLFVSPISCKPNYGYYSSCAKLRKQQIILKEHRFYLFFHFLNDLCALAHIIETVNGGKGHEDLFLINVHFDYTFYVQVDNLLIGPCCHVTADCP